MDDFEKELKQGFLEEATQLLADAERCFLALESNPGDLTVTDQLFRLAHNLKGSGKAVGFSELGDFTHKLESLLLKIKNKDITISKSIVDLLLACNDHLLRWINLLKSDLCASVDSSGLSNEIEAHLSGHGTAPSPAQESGTLGLPPTTAELSISEIPSADQFIEQAAAAPHSPASEPLSSPTSDLASAISPSTEAVAVSSPAPAPKPSRAPAAGTGDESIRVSLSRLEKLINFVGEIVILQSVLKEQSYADNSLLLRKSIHQLGKVTKEIQDISMSLRMVPLKQTFQKMQRIVRDTSAALNKKVAIVIEGDETEVDKTVLESLSDPMVHLIRNAVDHGIESADKRITSGKKEEGTILLKAYHQSGSLMIEVKDDGAGLDPEKLKNKAIEKGILRPGVSLTDAEAYALIFAPGFSTKQEVTDVSGRGVGMDVVRTNIEALQGDIQIQTELGKGTCFKVRLPLTLAIIDGMIVRLGTERYVIPLSHVHETVSPSPTDVKFATGMGEVFLLRGDSLPLYRLSQLLGRKGHERPASESTAIVVRIGSQPFAVLIDEIIGHVQVVIKQLGSEHDAIRGFSGSAILGDGRPALILELPELSQRAKPLASPTLQAPLPLQARNTA